MTIQPEEDLMELLREGGEEEREGDDEAAEDGGEAGALPATEGGHEGGGEERHGQAERSHPCCKGRSSVLI